MIEDKNHYIQILNEFSYSEINGEVLPLSSNGHIADVYQLLHGHLEVVNSELAIKADLMTISKVLGSAGDSVMTKESIDMINKAHGKLTGSRNTSEVTNISWEVLRAISKAYNTQNLKAILSGSVRAYAIGYSKGIHCTGLTEVNGGRISEA